MDKINILLSSIIANEDDNPRIEYRGIDALASSIRETGLLSPLVVANVEGDYYLLDGFRRYRALKMLGATHACCHVRLCARADLDIERAKVIGSTQQSNPLSPIENALYAKFLYENVCGGVQRRVAELMGIDASSVMHYLRVASLPSDIIDAVKAKKIPISMCISQLRYRSVEDAVTYIRHAISVKDAPPPSSHESLSDFLELELEEVCSPPTSGDSLEETIIDVDALISAPSSSDIRITFSESEKLDLQIYGLKDSLFSIIEGYNSYRSGGCDIEEFVAIANKVLK